jgi:hypothetical protein
MSINGKYMIDVIGGTPTTIAYINKNGMFEIAKLYREDKTRAAGNTLMFTGLFLTNDAFCSINTVEELSTSAQNKNIVRPTYMFNE